MVSLVAFVFAVVLFALEAFAFLLLFGLAGFAVDVGEDVADAGASAFPFAAVGAVVDGEAVGAELFFDGVGGVDLGGVDDEGGAVGAVNDDGGVVVALEGVAAFVYGAVVVFA